MPRAKVTRKEALDQVKSVRPRIEQEMADKALQDRITEADAFTKYTHVFKTPGTLNNEETPWMSVVLDTDAQVFYVYVNYVPSNLVGIKLNVAQAEHLGKTILASIHDFITHPTTDAKD